MKKITREWIENKIRKVDYLVMPGSTVTICSITLENGFSVRGESACVDPNEFNEALGQDYAYRDAYEKIWAFEGYLLTEGLWINRTCPEIQDFGWAIRQLKDGKKVARRGWNGKGMWISLSPGSSVYFTNFWSDANKKWAKLQLNSEAPVLPCITMKTVNADGREAILMGWLASQTDMLSEDWVLVE